MLPAYHFSENPTHWSQSIVFQTKDFHKTRTVAREIMEKIKQVMMKNCECENWVLSGLLVCTGFSGLFFQDSNTRKKIDVVSFQTTAVGRELDGRNEARRYREKWNWKASYFNMVSFFKFGDYQNSDAKNWMFLNQIYSHKEKTLEGDLNGQIQNPTFRSYRLPIPIWRKKL